MMLSTNPFAAEHHANLSSTPFRMPFLISGLETGEETQGVARQQSAAPGAAQGGGNVVPGPNLCPGNELDYTSTAAAMAAVHAVAIQPLRSGRGLAPAGRTLRGMGHQNPGAPAVASAAQSGGLAGQQWPLIRRNVLCGETEVAGVPELRAEPPKAPGSTLYKALISAHVWPNKARPLCVM